MSSLMPWSAASAACRLWRRAGSTRGDVFLDKAFWFLPRKQLTRDPPDLDKSTKKSREYDYQQVSASYLFGIQRRVSGTVSVDQGSFYGGSRTVAAWRAVPEAFSAAARSLRTAARRAEARPFERSS